MSLRRLIIALTFISIFAMAARISIDTDSWWHLRTGQWILEQRAIPHTDSFSYTRAGETWRYPSAAWLSEIQLYALYNAFGPGAVNLWVAAIATIAFIFIYLTLSGGPFLRFGTVALSAAAAAIFWSARPQMMSFLFAAVFLWVLEDFRWGRAKRLYLLPLVMLLWANSHPGFAIGFLLIAIYAVAAFTEALAAKEGPLGPRLLATLKPFILPGLLMIVAACINPSGPAMMRYPFDTLSIGVLRDFIQEWQSPDFHSLEMQPFLWLLLLSIFSLGFSKRRAALSDLLLLLVFGYLAFLAGRNVALFALAAAPVLSRQAQPLLSEAASRLHLRLDTASRPTRRAAALNVAILVLALVALGVKVSIIYPAKKNRAAFAEQLPAGAVDFLRAHVPPGRLFNSYNWGGYLIWALPEYPVFTDGRTDLYDDELLTTWIDIAGAEAGWEAQLEKWDVHLILLEPHWPLVKALEHEGWSVIYQDEISLLYQKEP